MFREQLALNCMRWRISRSGDFPRDRVDITLSHKDAEHSGYCTNDNWACIRCECDMTFKQVDELLKVFLENVNFG